MTIPFLSVRPKAVKLKVLARFPSQVIGGVGISAVKSNGNFEFDLDYSKFPPQTSIPNDPNEYVLLYNAATKQYLLVPPSVLFGLAEAPNDGFTYGRKSLAWSRALDLSGGTLTGPLVLSGDPSVPLGAASKQYVDGHTFADAPSDGFTYGRKNTAWSRSLDLSGGTLTGPLILNADPAAALGAATKQYVDSHTFSNTSRVITGNDTLLVSDAGKLIRLNSASNFTLAATAAATLGDGWFCDVLNVAAGMCTFDPNASETVDGVLTARIFQSERMRIRCIGSAFYTMDHAGDWVAYTPTIAIIGGGGGTIGSTVVGSGVFRKVRTIVQIIININLGSTPGNPGSNLSATLPVSAVGLTAALPGVESAVTGKTLRGILAPTVCSIANYDNTTISGIASAAYAVSGVYQVDK
jgi:hypothetical protein